MANAFTFAPDPAYGWGGTGAYMGRALFSALTNGMGMQQYWDQTQRQLNTTPSWIAAQQAQNAQAQMHANLYNAADQSTLGTFMRHYGQNPAANGYPGIASWAPPAQAPETAPYTPPVTAPTPPPVGSPGASVDNASNAVHPLSPVFNDYYARMLGGYGSVGGNW